MASPYRLSTGAIRQRQAVGGFTLIEMLVVLVVIGLLSGLMLLRPPHSAARDVDITARQVQQYIYALSQWSMDSGLVIGLEIGTDSLRAVQLTSPQNSAAFGSSTRNRRGTTQGADDLEADLQQRRLRGATRVSIIGQNRAAMMAASSTYAGYDRATDILLYPSGETSLFRLRVDSTEDSQHAFELSSDGLNIALSSVNPL